MVFYDAQWRVLGTKVGIAKLISTITGIDARLLRAQKSLHDFSCAQKMSWAAYRQTTRIEDRAYSLLGLFNICFSPVYGEGWRTFGRLQEEILKVSTDQSIFAWTESGYANARTPEFSKCSILAPTPDCFHDASTIIYAPISPDRNHPPPGPTPLWCKWQFTSDAESANNTLQHRLTYGSSIDKHLQIGWTVVDRGNAQLLSYLRQEPKADNTPD